MIRPDETYLGDGLYASVDPSGDVTLRAPRGNGDHFVVLEPNVLAAFEAWIANVRRVRNAQREMDSLPFGGVGEE